MMDDTTASLAAATASTLTTEAGGSSAGLSVPPVARGAAEALPLPDGGVIPVAVHGPPDQPACPDRIVAALSTAPPPSLHEEPPLSSSARTATASAPGPSGGSARAAPLAYAAVAGQAPPSLSSAPAVGFSSGAATSARGADILAEAVAHGISPLREDLQRVNTALGELTQEVRHLRMGHETLARGHERVVMTMTVVRGDISKAFDDLTASFESLSTKVCRGVGATEANDASSKVAVIKQLARSRLIERTGSATTSKDVCISTSRSWEEYVGLAAGVLGVAKAEASSWLLAYCDMPARKGASEVKSVRRCTPILRIKAHVMYQWKDVVTSAYFSALGISRQEITRQQALLLLANMAYLVSVRGFPAVVCAVEALLFLLGAGGRVDQPVSVGDFKTVNCSIGHVALVTSFVRVILEVAAGLRLARGGVGEGIHDVWVQELPRVDGALHRDVNAHNGLRLVDGADPDRGQVAPDDGEESSVDEAEDAAGGGGDGSAGAQ